MKASHVGKAKNQLLPEEHLASIKNFSRSAPSVEGAQ